MYMGRMIVDEWVRGPIIILGMFILRLGVPLAVTLAVGYWLRHLDAKWKAEAPAREARRVDQQEMIVEPEYGSPVWMPNGKQSRRRSR